MRLSVTNSLFFLTALFSLAALAKGSVVINEIYYKPADKTSPEEFVEIHNRNPTPVNLSGWRFTQGIDYTFPEGTVLEAGGRVPDSLASVIADTAAPGDEARHDVMIGGQRWHCIVHPVPLGPTVLLLRRQHDMAADADALRAAGLTPPAGGGRARARAHGRLEWRARGGARHVGVDREEAP